MLDKERDEGVDYSFEEEEAEGPSGGRRGA